MAEMISRWRRKRLAALILTAVILVLGVSAALSGMGDARLYSTLVIGGSLGAWCVIRSNIPDAVYNSVPLLERSPW
jgi:hypothetical protein